MGIILALAGLLAMLVGGIMLLVVAFKESPWWGLGSMFVPFVSLIFVIKHWDDTKKAFAYSMLGAVLCIAGAVMAPESMQQTTSTFP